MSITSKIQCDSRYHIYKYINITMVSITVLAIIWLSLAGLVTPKAPTIDAEQGLAACLQLENGLSPNFFTVVGPSHKDLDAIGSYEVAGGQQHQGIPYAIHRVTSLSLGHSLCLQTGISLLLGGLGWMVVLPSCSCFLGKGLLALRHLQLFSVGLMSYASVFSIRGT